VELHQVDAIGLQASQGFIDLLGGGLFGPAVDLGHEEDFLPVAIAQSLPHTDFTGTAIIVPAVVHESDPAVDGFADNRYALRFISLFADMISAQANGRDLFSSPPRARWGISSLVSAIKACGLAVLKTAAAAADFTNERRLIKASLWFVG
jgi:hypothetical protein